MKKTILFILFASFTLITFSQKVYPTHKIKKTFEKQYPESTVIRWGSTGDRIKEYQVLYQFQGVLQSTFYDNKANWLVTKIKIAESEVPQAVLKAIEEDYYSYDIVITARFEDPENKGFEVWLDNGQDGFDVQYSPEGKVLLRTLTSNGYKPIDDNGHFVEK